MAASQATRQRRRAGTLGEFLLDILDELDWLKEQVRLLNEDNKTLKSEIAKIKENPRA